MTVISNAILSKTNLLNFLLSFLPLSFIIGNLAINLNIFLIIIFALFLYGKKLILLKLNLIDKIVLSFFIYLILNSIIATAIMWGDDMNVYTLQDSYNFSIIQKTLLFQRFLILYFIIKFMVENNLINFKFFFISCSFFSLFVSLDIFYQFIFGYDIFGLPGHVRKYSGPFGDELIAGGYLQRFSIFSIFLIPIFFPLKNNKLSIILIIILFVIAFMSILISGNRMPFLLFLVMSILIFLFEKKIRKYFALLFVLFSLLFLIFYNFNANIKNNFDNFYGKAKTLVVVIFDKNYKKQLMIKDDPVLDFYKEFESFYETWMFNKYIGGGIKTFRYYCHRGFKNKIEKLKLDPVIDKEKLPEFRCNTHPHNYYLEILTELGVVGFVLSVFMFISIIYISLIKKYFMKSNLNNAKIITPFIFLFLIEVFPIKSSGGFFTTGNATYIFILIAIIAALSREKI